MNDARGMGMKEKGKKIRVLMVKPGMDGHWRGAMVVTMALRDAGMEVIYGGNQTPEDIVQIAIQESVDVIGMSVYSAGHIQLTTSVVEQLKKNNLKDVIVIVGGTIPRIDIPLLKEAGIDEVFLPGTPPEKVVEYIRKKVAQIQDSQQGV